MKTKHSLLICLVFIITTTINTLFCQTNNMDYWPTEKWQYKNPSEVQMDSLKLVELDEYVREEYKYIV